MRKINNKYKFLLTGNKVRDDYEYFLPVGTVNNFIDNFQKYNFFSVLKFCVMWICCLSLLTIVDIKC